MEISKQQKAALALEIIKLENNPTVKNFVAIEAMKQVAADLNEKSGGACTHKAVELLLCDKKNTEIKDRFDHYVAAGYHGILIAKFSN